MKLGSYAHISVSVSNLGDSLPFYEKTGFKKLWGNSEPKPWALLTDGRVNVHLFESEFSSPALHFFSSTMDETAQELTRRGFSLAEQMSKDGSRQQHMFSDPNEVSIMLMHHDDAEMPKPPGVSHSVLGAFGELSINTENLETSVEFWRKLDFVPLDQSNKPYPWALLSDGMLTLGLHQTKDFSDPALTYFSPDVAIRVRGLEQQGIPLKRLHDDGAILTAPDGQKFFLLKGDV